MTLIEHPATPLVLRIATTDDEPQLHYLAELDSALPFTGAALVAELDDRLVAGVSLSTGREVADPFVPTREILELMRVRARQLKPRLAPPGRLATLRSMLIRPMRSRRLLLR